MLIGIFKKSTVFTPLVLILVALLLWLDGFLLAGTQVGPLQQSAPLFAIMGPFIENFPLLQVLTAWVFLILQAFLINYVVTSKGLMDRYTLLPALLYIVVMSSSFSMLWLHPVLFANLFLILALNKIFDSYHEKHVAREVYNVGLLVAMAGLFYAPAALFFLMSLASLFVYRVANLRGLLAHLTGFATPFFFLIIVYYLTDSLHANLALQEHFSLFGVFNQDFSPYLQVLLAFLGLLFFISFFRVTFSHITDQPVRTRKRFNVLTWFFSVALLSVLAAGPFLQNHYAMMMIPLSMFLAVSFMEMKKNRWAEVIFSLLILLIVIGKVMRWG